VRTNRAEARKRGAVFCSPMQSTETTTSG